MTDGCLICCNQFDNQDHCPRLLGCGHTLCESCVAQLPEINGSLECPLKCDKVTGSLSHAPINHQLMARALCCPRCKYTFGNIRQPIALLSCGHSLCVLCADEACEGWPGCYCLRCPECKLARSSSSREELLVLNRSLLDWTDTTSRSKCSRSTDSLELLDLATLQQNCREEEVHREATTHTPIRATRDYTVQFDQDRQTYFNLLRKADEFFEKIDKGEGDSVWEAAKRPLDECMGKFFSALKLFKAEIETVKRESIFAIPDLKPSVVRKLIGSVLQLISQTATTQPSIPESLEEKLLLNQRLQLAHQKVQKKLESAVARLGERKIQSKKKLSKISFKDMEVAIKAFTRRARKMARMNTLQERRLKGLARMFAESTTAFDYHSNPFASKSAEVVEERTEGSLSTGSSSL